MICRNLKINGRRTSVRMEQSYWEALDDVAKRRGLSMRELATEVDLTRGKGTLTDALRLTALAYFCGLVDQLDRYGMLRAPDERISRLRFRYAKRRHAEHVKVARPKHATLQ